MVIGIKYCGGCNPRYDRLEIARRLGKEFPHHTLRGGDGERAPDFAAVICGCPSRCASHEAFTDRCGKFVLSSLEEYGQLRDRIVQCDKELKHGLEGYI